MPKRNQKVVVIGHQNPDTDSICSAIAYAALKNQEGGELTYEARRAGRLNQESAFVLKRFGVEPPRMCTDVLPKVRDVEYREMEGVPGEMSLRRAWTLMRDRQIDTLPVVAPDQELLGVITVKDIATANMDVFDTHVLAKSHTSYRNILETLSGEMLIGDPDAIVERGKLLIGASSPELMEAAMEAGDIVLLSNRYESQLCAIEMEASLIIVCSGATVGRTILKLAEENGVAIIVTNHDSYAAAKLISQCAPISHYMTTKDIVHFTPVTPVDDALHIMGKVRHRYFPIVDTEGKYIGMLSRRNLMNLQQRKLILVDHNEATQAVEGYDRAEILEIIDHHRIGSLETSGPVYFRNQPVGCTATIVYQMYQEHGIVPTPQIAGLLLAAILSDTLMFRSPTCTRIDEMTAQKLAEIAGEEIESFASDMFQAAENLEGRSAEQVFLQDFKVFMCGDVRFGVAQGNYMTQNNLEAARLLLQPYLEEARSRQGVEDVYVLLTDVPKSTSSVIYSGHRAQQVLQEGFDAECDENGVVLLEGVVSRKKQFLPAVMAAYQQI